MTGSILQLVAKGMSDLYMTGSPQITFFKMVYRRHINFSIYDTFLYPAPSGKTNFGSAISINIDRRGDLLHNMYLVIDLPNIDIKFPKPTFQLISEILQKNNITWSTNLQPNDIVTLSNYNLPIHGIVDTINQKITNLIQNYNFDVETLKRIKQFNSSSFHENSNTRLMTNILFPDLLLNPLSIYDTNLSKQIENHGILLSGIYAYYLDNSSPQRLYNADDYIILTYNSYLNNIVRIQNTKNNITPYFPFDPLYVNINLINNGINLKNKNINPDSLFISDNIVFYHVIDMGTSGMALMPNLYGTPILTYFLNIIDYAYTNQITLVPEFKNNYSNTDAYKIFQNIMNNLEITELNDNLVSLITNNIYWNIQYNLLLIDDVITVLNAFRYDLLIQNSTIRSPIFSFYRQFAKNDNIFNADSDFNLVPNTIINNNFVNNIIKINLGKKPTNVTPFFMNTVDEILENYPNDMQDFIRKFNDYTSQYELWQRVLPTSSDMRTILTKYNLYDKFNDLHRVSVMNYIPFLAIRDIPVLLNDVLIKNELLFVPTDPMHNQIINDLFREFMDLTDEKISDDDLILKNNLYEQISKRIIVNYLNDPDDPDNLTNIEELQILQDIYAPNRNKNIIVTLFRPEFMFPRYSYVDLEHKIVDILDTNNNSRFLPIEWITETYRHLMIKKAIDFISKNYIPGSNISQEIQQQNFFNLVSSTVQLINNVINSFILPELPDFTNYQTNGYVLYNIDDPNRFDLIQTPKYSDAISSIWYQIQRKFIQMYNNLFNDVLLSKKYYDNSLGLMMGQIFDFFKTTMEAYNQIYYSNNHPELFYPNVELDVELDIIIPNNYLFDSNYFENMKYFIYPSKSLIYPAVPDEGFDFYRFNITKDILNPFEMVNNYISDMTTLFNFIYNRYQQRKNILNIKNDKLGLQYKNGNMISIRMRDQYIYESSSVINNLIFKHVQIAYIPFNIGQLNAITNDLNRLVSQTANYWTSSNMIGVLDYLYGENSIVRTFERLNLDNPFKTDNLIKWYEKYPNMNWNEILGLFNNYFLDFMNVPIVRNKPIFYTQDHEIVTSNLLYSDQYANIYYSDYATTNDLIWFVMDRLTLNSPIKNLVGLIGPMNNSWTQVYNSMIEYYQKNIDMNQNILLKITKLKPTVNRMISLGYDYPMYMIGKLDNTDIYYYQYSISGRSNNDLPLENQLLNMITRSRPKFAWVRELGHALVKNATITIGSQMIEEQTRELLHMYYRMTNDLEHDRGYDTMIGNVPTMYVPSSEQKPIHRLYIPLNFWFSRNVGNALPLLALLYADVILKINFSSLNEVLYIEDGAYFVKQPNFKSSVLAEYIYLEDDERVRMAGTKLEYLTERFISNGRVVLSSQNLGNLNDISVGNDSMFLKLNLYDPVKYLIWTFRFYDSTTQETIDIIDWNKYGYNVRNPKGKIIHIDPIFKWGMIVINGVKREEPKAETWFTNVNPYAGLMSSFHKGEYLYSYSLFPLLIQPSGTANHSMLLDSFIVVSFTDEIVNLLTSNPNLRLEFMLWACTYNVLRVFSGMAGLAFYG